MVLRGWKAIADHIKKSVRMSKYYLHYNPPLPVYGFGDRGEVQASTDELDQWMKSMVRHRGLSRIAQRCTRLPEASAKPFKRSRLVSS